MRMRDDRWEQGSHFHHVVEYEREGMDWPSPWTEARFYYSGRPALNDLLEHLSPERKRTVWMPAYYCDDVVNPIVRAGHPRRYFDGNPVSRYHIPTHEIQEGDLFIANVYFGIDALSDAELAPVRARGAIVIDDHSQDPYSELAYNSVAEYSYASLRKSLPLPDGGVLWSPQGKLLPGSELTEPPVFPPRLGGMLAKRLYLSGEFDDKDVYREWFAASERDFTDAGTWAISPYSLRLLYRLDIGSWRAQRARNHAHLVQRITTSALELPYRERSGDSPMGLVMLAPDRAVRDHFRSQLIAARIYPVVYWPPIPDVPPEVSEQALDFVDRMLFLHMDARYDEGDMERIAEVISRIFSHY